jgi:uncharacterized membrane protein
MMVASQIDEYLSSLRAHLGPITLSEREEIVREISAHIRDSSEQEGASVADVLARLGPAEALAAQYRDGLLIRRASRSISPILLMRGAMRLATKGVFGVIVFFAGLFGYGIGGGCVLSALMKTIFPAHTGMWFRNGRLISSGTLFPPPPPGAHEVLGWAYIPIFLTAGSVLLLLTSILIRASLRVSERWQLQISRRSHSI